MFNIELLELQIEIAELQALGLDYEEIQGYLEFWAWNFKDSKENYDIQ